MVSAVVPAAPASSPAVTEPHTPRLRLTLPAMATSPELGTAPGHPPAARPVTPLGGISYRLTVLGRVLRLSVP
ncbi:hypothetical protein GCM10009677_04450 [Sphaerisporangium rubeum]